MTRKPNMLIPVLVTAFVMSALIGSSAQAANFTASSYPTTVTAESAAGNTVFTTEGGTVECKDHYSGTLSAASSALQLTRTSTNCKAFGFVSAEITRFNCRETITAGSGDIHRECEKEIVHASTCTVELKSQSSLKSVSLANTGSGDITMQMNVSGIAYTVTKDGFLCPFNGTGAKTGGTLKQGSAITVDSTNGASFSVS